MTMLLRAKKAGRKFLNPVPTTIGGFGTLFKVLPRFLKQQGGEDSAAAVGAFPNRCCGVWGGSGERAAGDVDGALIDAGGDRWSAGAGGSGLG